MSYDKKRGITKYCYPKWIKRAVKYAPLNDHPTHPLYVSVLQDSKGEKRPMLDIRVWTDSAPTYAGIFLGYNSALIMRDILDQFINGDLTDI